MEDTDMTMGGDPSSMQEPAAESSQSLPDQMTGVKQEGDVEGKDNEERGGEEDADRDGSPKPRRRMTTRAQASQANGSQTQPEQTEPSTPSLSGTLQSASDTDITMEPHPLFLLPPTLHVDRSCGIPQQEADETRHLLWAYIQKQEVSVRLFSEMLDHLLKAYRMKDDVWEWCKAEGHVGEMSDGEDWYDPTRWGLAEGETLRKGADDDEIEVDEGRATGKRGRTRRNQ
jgi:hypothetical protein